jgi:hypothetical protein
MSIGKGGGHIGLDLGSMKGGSKWQINYNVLIKSKM